MKLSKEMTKREKIMLVALIVILIGLGWFKLIYEPINDEVDTINSNTASEQSEIDANMVVLANLNKMEKSLEEYKANGTEPVMPTADNSKELLVKLNKIMTLANEYSINFGEPQQDDYLVSRTVQLSFITDTYKEARVIIDKLNSETYINQISDVSIELEKRTDEEYAKVDLTITFFEVVQ